MQNSLNEAQLIQAEAIYQASCTLNQLGLNRGTTGNISLRCDDGFIITPSGIPPEEMSRHSMVMMDIEGIPLSAGKPSSEWRFHRDIYQAKPEVGAVVHTHSPFATTLACLRLDIPAFHYMISQIGGNNIRCAPYALFGTQALSEVAIQALQDRRTCLLANHGMIATGINLAHALDMAIATESLCEQYWRALQIGTPHLLSEEEMKEVFAQFNGYGKWSHV